MSPELGSLLRTVVKSYTLHPLSEGTLKLISPFYQIIHHWDALESETQKEGGTEEDQTARSDLRDLLSQLSEWSGDANLDRYMQARRDLVFADSITFEALWTIFPPGTLDDDGGTAYPGSTFPTMQPQMRGPFLKNIGYHGSIELVMVDFASHYKYAQVGQCVGTAALNDDTYDRIPGAPEYDWEDEQFMLCSARVMGYILQEKMWAQFLVDGIEDIDVDGSHTAFNDRLVLPEDPVLDRKAVLMGLVKSHYAAYSDNLYQLEDIVPGKGKGLIILLYGPPGVGKTSTAETIAIATRKPLLSIGVADVGTSARYVEPNLERIFDLAQTWKAILLIDEADVFLQSRGSGQVGATTERNALVSVFLRVLEYYRGIMILTTNQIAQFDVAVQSRINIAFKYESLTPKQTADIFKMFLKQYKKNDMVNMEEWNDINNWCEKKLPKKGFDGRQIRNVITSAVGLAASKDEKLGVAYLEDVVEIVSDFKNELSKQMDRYTQAQAFIEQRQ
ncbi:hypothetical protein PFICI_01841 [Pestalotiopsis fici W106-1]|uniref:AAA+ ATPase domain-containing protein n=1 Tax=Pestalotiopsis fici (strain W106-1 / CGMCC3.15140) TaxID=1229662 RepID=W3XPM8_PESFW|nr:uncharacterized protein PFICI_01841 [Pestalotiopsis fici W106-1]ETS88013.1 hypothetical protein PFICI_01841 [Pestalotiopsis fici W106-1]